MEELTPDRKYAPEKGYKVDVYGLRDIVLHYRQLGYSTDTVAKEINRKHLPPGGAPISSRAIERWEEANGFVFDSRKKGVGFTPLVNVYDTAAKELKRIDNSLKKIQDRLDNTDTPPNNAQDLAMYEVEVKTREKNLLDYLAIQERLVARKQSLLKEISNYQKQILNQENQTVLFEILVQELKKEPEIFRKIAEKLREHREALDILRMIK